MADATNRARPAQVPAPEAAAADEARARRLALAHGAFNVVAGVWPLVSIGSFERIFGPKADRWLEYTVAGLLLTNGISQIGAARRGQYAAARLVGCGTAASLLAVDLVFVPSGRIRWTYLLDGAMELAWLAAWSRVRADAAGTAPA